MTELIEEELIFKGPRFDVKRQILLREDGLKYDRDTVIPGDSVFILAVDENDDVIFIKQYRATLGDIYYEIPAGCIEPGEKLEDAAKREFEEETGFIAEKLEVLVSYYPSAGYTNEKSTIFLATNLKKGNQHLDETEEITSVEKIHIDECMKKALNNEFLHASIYIALFNYYYKYKNQ